MSNPRRELRATGHNVHLRAAEDGDGYLFSGYATVFDAPYEVSDFLGDYRETIRTGAFSRTLNNGADVRLLLNHDGVPLARTKSGTLTLSQDDTGLWCEARLDAQSTLVRDIKSAMDRGDLDQMSFAFRATRQEWNEDYTSRDITEAQLYDVSIVTYPANPATSASMRSAIAARHGVAGMRDLVRQLRGDSLTAQAREMLLSLLITLGVDAEMDEPCEPQEDMAPDAAAPAETADVCTVDSCDCPDCPGCQNADCTCECCVGQDSGTDPTDPAAGSAPAADPAAPTRGELLRLARVMTDL